MAHRFRTIARANTTERGYGPAHQAARRAALNAYRPSDPCHLCGRPLGTNTRAIHLDHTPDRSAYRGLTHARCNRLDGGAKGRASQKAKRVQQQGASPHRY